MILPLAYHASHDGNVKLIQPVQTRWDKRPIVLAADNVDLAVALGVEWAEDDFLLQEEAGVYVMKELRVGAFKEHFEAAPLYVYRMQDRGFQPAGHLPQGTRSTYNPVQPFGLDYVNAPLRYLSRAKMVRIVMFTD